MTRTTKSQTKVVAQPSSEPQSTVKSDPVVKSLDTQPVALVPTVADEPKKGKKSSKKVVKESEPVSTPQVPVQVLDSVSKSEHTETPLITVETLDGELLNVDEFDTKCAEYYAKLQDLTSSISTIRSEFKSIEKVWAKRLKTATKTNIKKKKKSGNRAPSGFVKPTKISDELALFLNKPAGTEMARTEVTREINLYIRANKLQDTTNGRKINADKKLSELLQLPSEDELTYFNLQKYMSVHFPKTPAVVV
jgi:chromatin remodeling complex protein RSC6